MEPFAEEHGCGYMFRPSVLYTRTLGRRGEEGEGVYVEVDRFRKEILVSNGFSGMRHATCVNMRRRRANERRM